MALAQWLSHQLSLFGEAVGVPSKHALHGVSDGDGAALGATLTPDRVVTPLNPLARSQNLWVGPTEQPPTRDHVHPNANRSMVLAGSKVGFLLRRSKRKTIGFLVSADGLVVSAPRWVLVGEVESAVREKADWILRKLQETRERASRLSSQRIEWRDGVTFPFLGEPVVVVLDPSHALAGGAVLTPLGVGGSPLSLTISLPHTATPEQIRDAVQAWLMRQAKRVFAERLEAYAPQLKVSCGKLRLSSAGTRWGSASADGTIRLNWRLIHFKLSTIDYVVVHELSHLRVMDHSPRFWEVVESVMPGYAQQRAELRSDHSPRWD